MGNVSTTNLKFTLTLLTLPLRPSVGVTINFWPVGSGAGFGEAEPTPENSMYCADGVDAFSWTHAESRSATNNSAALNRILIAAVKSGAARTSIQFSGVLE